jgi:hypothetical protein
MSKIFSIKSGVNYRNDPVLCFSPAMYNALINGCKELRSIIAAGRPLSIKDIAALAPLVILADHALMEEEGK